MLSSIFTTNSTFENSLSQFISDNSQNLNESLLQKIFSTLRGQNELIKSQFAFASLKKMLGGLQLNRNEQKTLRLLIVFDKLVQDSLFFQQISKINFLSLQVNRISTESSFNSNLTKILKLFWKIIKEKSILIKDKNHILIQKRSQRTYPFQKLKPPFLIAQLQTISTFFSYIFEMLYYIQGPNYSQISQMQKKNKIFEYISIHLLYKLLALYSCQMTINKFIVKKLKELQRDSIIKFKRTVIKFRENCNNFINLIKKYSNTHISQIIHLDLIKVQFNEHIVQYIDNYLHTLHLESMQPTLTNLPIELGKIIVEKKLHNNSSQYHERLKVKCSSTTKKQGIKEESNVFDNWHNSYSHQFPQKQILTVDLILQIKLQQSLNTQKQEQAHQYLYSSRCSYDNRSTNISSNYSINCFVKKQYFILNKEKELGFDNIYSQLQGKWNQA